LGWLGPVSAGFITMYFVIQAAKKDPYSITKTLAKGFVLKMVFYGLYIIIFFALTAILTLTGLNFVTAISGAATSISNVGPGLGDTIGPNGNFSQLPNFSKWILSLGMILGRLELFAILVLFLPSFWQK